PTILLFDQARGGFALLNFLMNTAT
ncbi:hypothetical protein D030_4539B, partial [Vibrio parahaemolyticus AQ3810]